MWKPGHGNRRITWNIAESYPPCRHKARLKWAPLTAHKLAPDPTDKTMRSGAWKALQGSLSGDTSESGRTAVIGGAFTKEVFLR